MSEAPEGWICTSLADLGVEAKSGFASGKHADAGELLHLRPMNITRQGRLTLEGAKYVSQSAGAARTQSGDVLFNNTNSPALVGKTAYVDTDSPLGFSNHMTRLRFGDHLDAKFLALQLQTMQEEGYFESICSNHVNQASVAAKRLLQVQIMVPPLVEQCRIVELLEDHLSRLDAAEANLTRAALRAEFLPQSMLAALMGTRTTSSVRLATLATSSGYGTSAKCVVGGPGTAVVRIPNIRDGRIDLRDEKRVADPVVDVSGLMLNEGDLVIVRTNGSRELMGRTAVVQLGVDASFASYLIRYRLDPARANPDWVSLVLETPAARSVLESLAASSAGQYNLSLSKLNGVEIPLPSLEEQVAILAQVGEQSEAVARVRAEASTAARRSVSLRRALLAAAFSGKFTGATSDLKRIEELVPA